MLNSENECYRCALPRMTTKLGGIEKTRKESKLEKEKDKELKKARR